MSVDIIHVASLWAHDATAWIYFRVRSSPRGGKTFRGDFQNVYKKALWILTDFAENVRLITCENNEKEKSHKALAFHVRVNSERRPCAGHKSRSHQVQGWKSDLAGVARREKSILRAFRSEEIFIKVHNCLGACIAADTGLVWNARNFVHEKFILGCSFIIIARRFFFVESIDNETKQHEKLFGGFFGEKKQQKRRKKMVRARKARHDTAGNSFGECLENRSQLREVKSKSYRDEGVATRPFA